MDNEQFGQLMSSIAEVKTETISLRRELLGNGQPGRIQLLEADVSECQDAISRQGKKFAWYAGASTALGFVVTTVGSYLHFHNK